MTLNAGLSFNLKHVLFSLCMYVCIQTRAFEQWWSYLMHEVGPPCCFIHLIVYTNIPRFTFCSFAAISAFLVPTNAVQYHFEMHVTGGLFSSHSSMLVSVRTGRANHNGLLSLSSTLLGLWQITNSRTIGDAAKAMHHGGNVVVTLPSFCFSIFPFHLRFTHPATPSPISFAFFVFVSVHRLPLKACCVSHARQ